MGVSRDLSQEKSTAQGNTVQYYNLWLYQNQYKYNGKDDKPYLYYRFRRCGGFSNASKYSLGLSNVFQLFDVCYTHMFIIQSIKQTQLFQILSKNGLESSLHLLYICKEKKKNMFWFYCCLCSLRLSGTLELQYRGIARKGQRTLVHNLPLFCSV